MKKATILVIGILSMLVISGAAALKTNVIIQSPSEPSRLVSFEDTPGIVIEASEIGLVDFNNATELIAAPYYTPYAIENCTGNFNFTVVLPPMTANVYTDKETYGVGEIITYGIENTLNYNIGGVSVSIEKMVTCNWEPVLLTYYMPLLLQPGEVYESTWDQKVGYGLQVETGWYRVAIGYGYYDGVSKHSMGYAYFSITDAIPLVILDFPVNVTDIANNTDSTPFIIPPGYPWFNATIVNNTDGTPFIILHGFPWVKWDYREYTDTTPFIIMDLPVKVYYSTR